LQPRVLCRASTQVTPDALVIADQVGEEEVLDDAEGREFDLLMVGDRDVASRSRRL
jgi:hypothetical protein